MRTVTITFDYVDGEKWQEFFKEQISTRVAIQNPNAEIQVTSWHLGDALEELELLKEIKDDE